ncbi:hypothetical protein C8R44DRAFT_942614 [Mycena epipterygia]|nr:hypothetical protein C8R44DRAFT_942614 [Mycena epipterygia]
MQIQTQIDRSLYERSVFRREIGYRSTLSLEYRFPQAHARGRAQTPLTEDELLWGPADDGAATAHTQTQTHTNSTRPPAGGALTPTEEALRGTLRARVLCGGAARRRLRRRGRRNRDRERRQKSSSTDKAKSRTRSKAVLVPSVNYPFLVSVNAGAATASPPQLEREWNVTVSPCSDGDSGQRIHTGRDRDGGRTHSGGVRGVLTGD